LGVEVVYQDLALCENLDIVENMFLGRELKTRGMLDEARMETMARGALGSGNSSGWRGITVPVAQGVSPGTVAARMVGARTHGRSGCGGFGRWGWW
jgi:hypothetical protein